MPDLMTLILLAAVLAAYSAGSFFILAKSVTSDDRLNGFLVTFFLPGMIFWVGIGMTGLAFLGTLIGRDRVA